MHGSFEPVPVHAIALVDDGSTAFKTPLEDSELPQEATTTSIEQLVRTEFEDTPRMLHVAHV